MRRAIVLAVALLAVSNFSKAQPTLKNPKAAAGNKLVVVQYADDTSWPWSRQGATGFEGFEPALATAICEKLNATCEFVPATTYDERFSLLSNGANFSFGSISVTDERKGLYGFVQPYYASAGATLFAPENVTVKAEDGWDALVGKTVCIEEGNYAVDIVKGLGIDVSLVEASIPVDQRPVVGNDRINSGECVGSIYDSTYPAHWGNSQVGLPALEKVPYGIAVAKGNDDLRRKLSAAMVEMMADGDVSEILKLESEKLVSEGVPANPDLAATVEAISNFGVENVESGDEVKTEQPSSATSGSAAAVRSYMAGIAVAGAILVAV